MTKGEQGRAVHIRGSYLSYHALSPTWKEDLPEADLCVIKAGEHWALEGYRVGPRTISHHTLTVTVAGKGEFTSQGHTYRLHRGSAFWIFPGVRHVYSSDPVHKLNTVYIAFIGRNVSSIEKQLGLTPELPYLDLGSHFDNVVALIRSATEAFKRFHGLDAVWEGKSLLWKVLSLLLSIQKEANRSPTYPLDPVSAVMDIVRTHYSQPWSVRELAHLVKMSPSRLHAVFKQEVGMSPYAFLVHIRMEKAKALLQETKLHVAEVGASVGIDDASYFSRLFRRYVGASPTEVRKQQRAERQDPSKGSSQAQY